MGTTYDWSAFLDSVSRAYTHHNESDVVNATVLAADRLGNDIGGFPVEYDVPDDYVRLNYDYHRCTLDVDVPLYDGFDILRVSGVSADVPSLPYMHRQNRCSCTFDATGSHVRVVIHGMAVSVTIRYNVTIIPGAVHCDMPAILFTRYHRPMLYAICEHLAVKSGDGSRTRYFADAYTTSLRALKSADTQRAKHRVTMVGGSRCKW